MIWGYPYFRVGILSFFASKIPAESCPSAGERWPGLAGLVTSLPVLAAWEARKSQVDSVNGMNGGNLPGSPPKDSIADQFAGVQSDYPNW